MFHRHKWIPMSTKLWSEMWETGGLKSEFTLILQGCMCGGVRTEKIKGHWNEEIVLRGPPIMEEG